MDIKRKTHTIDVTDRALGRVATEIATLLQGKHKPSFFPNKDQGDFVIAKNIEKVKLSGNKMKQKTYFSHSGYMGSGKHIPVEKIFKRDPGEVLKKAVMGMLPKNRLRQHMIKRLSFVKGNG